MSFFYQTRKKKNTEKYGQNPDLGGVSFFSTTVGQQGQAAKFTQLSIEMNNVLVLK